VRLLFERLASSGAGTERLAGDHDLATTVAAVAGASRSLARVILTDPAALDVLAGVRTPLDAGAREGPSLSLPDRSSSHLPDPLAAEDPDDLARRKRLALLLIAARDLAGLDDLETVGSSLSNLADGVLNASYRLAGVGEEQGARLAVIAMGKHGARELNYASDVDVMFVIPPGEEGTVGGVALARRVLAIAGRAFRIDTDLRPEGRNGVLARSLDSYMNYWDRWARPWEFQALLKARFAAGDADLGRAFAERSAATLWGRPLGAEDLAELRSMKGRAEQLVSRRGLADREIKRGRGGIRDIEFAVQLLQLVHGGADPLIRRPATLPALAELATAGYIEAGDASALALSYRFLRTLEHRLQLVEEAQVHTVPDDPDARAALARVLGLSRGLDAVLGRYQASARAIHERLFFRPLLEVFATRASGRASETGVPGEPRRLSEPDGRLSQEAAEARLQAFGFRQADRTRQALTELTRGLTRSSRLMQQLLPVLLGWLSETPDPDQGLFGLRTLVGSRHRRDVVVAAFRESPELARRLCVLLGTGRQLGELVGRQPALATRLGDDGELTAPVPAELQDRASRAAASADGRGQAALRHLVQTETLRIAAADVLLDAPLASTSSRLAGLGDAVLAAALEAVGPPLPMGIVAMGRLGGEELAYGSDLDVLIVYEGSGAGDAALAEEATAAVFRRLNGITPADRVLTVDASLRPEGRQGPLARSLEAYAEYHRRWIETWERQALLRARPVAGDDALLERFMDLVDSAIFAAPFGDAEVRSIRRLKARVERERIPASEDPNFHLKLGRGSLSDIEWLVQLLQLTHGVRGTGTLAGLGRLAAVGVLDSGEATVLSEAYRFLSETRNRWHLVGNFVAGAGGVVSSLGSDSLPTDRDQLARLARALGTSPTDLREAYRRVTRRARQVMERRFYGL